MAKSSAGMLTDDTVYAGGTPDFDERTGQPTTGSSTTGDGTGPVKGDPVKQAPIVTQTFTLIEGREKGDRDFQNYLYGQEGEPRQVTVDELRDYFESDDVNRLREMFGTFDNYLAYMTEREQLLQSGDLTIGNWSEADAGLTEDQEMILEGDADLTIDPSDPGQNLENLIGQQRGARVAGYQNWLNSEANQALLQKYGVQSTVYSESGDKFQWNGSAYVKVEEASSPGVTDFVKSGILAAMTFYAGGPLTQALGPVFGGNTALAAGASAGITNSAMQLLATGEVDLGQALQSAISAGLSTSAINYLQESGALDALTESLNDLTQDTVRLADGTELPLNQVSTGVYEVTLPSGNTIGYEAFAQVAESLMGSPIVAEVTRSLPDWINDVADAFAASGTAQGVVDLLQSTQGGPSAAGATVSGDLNFQPSDVTFLDQLREAIEREENPETRAALEEELRRYEEDEEEVDVNEDDTVEDADSTLGDTTTDNAPGITEEMFQDVVDQVRADNQVETQEIINAINALGVADLPTLAQIEAAFPELNDVSLEEIGNTVSTLLSEAGLLTSEEFTEAMAGVLTPDELATALANLPYGDAQDFIDAISNAGYATPEDVATALNNADLMSNEDFSSYMEQFREDVVGDVSTLLDEALAGYGFTEEQLAQIASAIDIPPSATVEEIQNIVDNLPEGLTAEQVATQLSGEFEGLAEGIQGVQSGIDQLAEDLGLSTEGLIAAISGLGEATGEDLTELQTNILEGLGLLSQNLGVDIGDVVTSVTDLETNVAEGIEGLGEQLTGLGEGITGVQGGIEDLADQLGLSTEDLITAIGNLSTATGESLTGLETSILTGLGSLADTLGLDVGEVVTSVTDLSADVVEGIEGLEGQLTTGFQGVQGGIEALAEQLGVSSDDIVTAIGNLGTLTSEELTGFETSVLTGLTDLASTLGLDIGDVVTSVTDLGADFTENITGLSEQLTGVEEAVGGVTTAVNQGIEELAEALGVQTDDITSAIVTLGSGLGGELTELETSVLTGLTNLATSLGTDVGTVVDSIGGLGTGISENIQGLSDTLTEQLGTGFGGISGQLESGFGQLGQQLGLATLGLLGLGAKQPTAQQIAAAKPFEFKPFEEKASPRQVQQVVRSEPIRQQPSALQQLNQFLDRQSTTPQKPPRKPGMLA